MTREQLESYRSMKAEIRELKEKISCPDSEDMTGSSVINDYRSGYPVPQAITGIDWGKVFRTEKRYKGMIARLEKECSVVEDYIENIEDSMTRRIFRMYYLEGMSQKQIEKEVHIDRSRISRKIKNFFEG